MDDVDRMRDLLVRAADLPGLAAPPAPHLIVRGRRRRRNQHAALATAVAMCLAAAIAVPLTVSAHHGSRPVATTPTPIAPAPTTRVSAAALAAGHWSQLAPAPIAGRSSSATIWSGTQMIIWGGSAQSGTVSRLFDDGAAYDPRSNTWRKLPPSPLSARAQTTSVWTGSAFVVWGGIVDAAGTGPRALDGARYDPAARSWSRLPSAPVSGYTSARAVWTGSQVVLVTAPKADTSILNVVAYDPATNGWTRWPDLALTPGEPGNQFVVVAAGPNVYLWSQWSYLNQVSPNEYSGDSGIAGYTLDVGRRSWTPNRLRPSSVHGVNGAQWTGRTVVFPAQQSWRGYASGPPQINLTSTVVDPGTGSVLVIPHNVVDDLGARFFWTGDAWLAYDTRTTVGGGGSAVVHYPGEAALWNAGTGAWTQLPSAPLTSGDESAAVWTGTELLMWGTLYPPAQANSAKPPALRTAGLRFGP